MDEFMVLIWCLSDLFALAGQMAAPFRADARPVLD